MADRTTPPPLDVETWVATHRRLTEEMCSVRPGLRPEQAYAALEALRTLRWVIHRTDIECPTPAETADQRGSA